ncbi:ribosome biogenesis related GTPase, putative [Babesia ovis]|uniref:Ribosome biogenesis related GTPase, putative n=1 Tax=Babesia ovis TaxID=5869 RepID=A0A9W5WVG6_BABOV|nr:ribosome biogenesis related GTPase, putative [Babesia ovis]
MGVSYPLTLFLYFNNVILALNTRWFNHDGLCFAFYRAGRQPRRPRRSSLSPDQLARLADLERDLDESVLVNQPDSSSAELNIDRCLGSSYRAVRSRRNPEDISSASPSLDSTSENGVPIGHRAQTHALDDSLRQQCNIDTTDSTSASTQCGPLDLNSLSSEPLESLSEHEGVLGVSSPLIAGYDGILDDTLHAAEQWEQDDTRYRNRGEIIDDITDREMVQRAEEELKRERLEGPTMKELFATLEDPSDKAPKDEWKQLVQHFEIDADSTHCVGCGIRLQSANHGLQGYISPDALSSVKESSGRPRCQRCSSMRSGLIFRDPGIAVGTNATTAAQETVAILRNALSLSATRHVTVVYMLDAMDLHFERGLADLIASRRSQRKAETHFYVVLNKIDLLPPHSRKRLIMYVHRYIQSRAPSLNLKPRHIFLMSSRTGAGVNLFLSVLLDEAYRKRSKVFFVGATNTGKSTFINRLSGFVSSKTSVAKQALLSTSVVPGTTLRPLRIATGPGFEMYDTPGIVVPDAFTSFLTPSELKVAVPATLGPNKPLRIGAGQTLLLGPFVRIDILEGRPFFFTPYMSKHIDVSVMRTSRVAQFLSREPFGECRHFYGMDSAVDNNDMYHGSGFEGDHMSTDHIMPTYDMSKGYDIGGEHMSNGYDIKGDHMATEPISTNAAELPTVIHSNMVMQTTKGSVSTPDVATTKTPSDHSTISREVVIVGSGWDRATTDLCFKGLGFVTLAGALELRLRVETLEGVGVYMREPMMPFDAIPFSRRRVPRKGSR